MEGNKAAIYARPHLALLERLVTSRGRVMDVDPKVAIHAFLNKLVNFREDLQASQEDLETSFQRLIAELQPCATTFREFQNAAEEWGKIGGTLARMVSEVLLDSLPPSRDKGG